MQCEMKKSQLVLLRHGQSEWNMQNIFTGWVDVALTEAGKIEAKEAGVAIRKIGLAFDGAYVSLLKRAIQTFWISVEESDLLDMPLQLHYALNERHYGGLQGWNKAETEKKYGSAQYLSWRRGYHTAPPRLQFTNPSDYCHQHKYRSAKLRLYRQQGLEKLPVGESLFDTEQRVILFFTKTILPRIREGERIFIVAHGNSLRVLIKWLTNQTENEIRKVELPTGQPIFFGFKSKSKSKRGSSSHSDEHFYRL